MRNCKNCPNCPTIQVPRPRAEQRAAARLDGMRWWLVCLASALADELPPSIALAEPVMTPGGRAGVRAFFGRGGAASTFRVYLDETCARAHVSSR